MVARKAMGHLEPEVERDEQVPFLNPIKPFTKKILKKKNITFVNIFKNIKITN